MVETKAKFRRELVFSQYRYRGLVVWFVSGVKQIVETDHTYATKDQAMRAAIDLKTYLDKQSWGKPEQHIL